MKMVKPVVALLSTSLIVSAMAWAPVSGYAKTTPQPQKNILKSHAHVDWGVVNEERLRKELVKQGKLDKNASEKEIQKAIEKYVTRGQNPHSHTDGIDTSKPFGKKAYKGLKKLQKKVEEKISKWKENTPEKKSNKHRFTDNAVVALIEFPDYPHNSIPKEGNDYLWVEDFNQKHYENLLFNPNGFLYQGKKMVSLKQFYLEQSSGYWNVDGVVTPWIKAKHNAKYYGEHYITDDYEMNDARPRELVKETLAEVGKHIAGKEALFDQRDPYDLDGDGNVMEPDGLLDNLFIVHSGMGEEAGGGELGEDAIWSHRSVIGPEPIQIPGTTLKAFDYIIQPEDGATGVFAHEYGHNLGLPDEYDILYSGGGAPVEYWSVMSAGSWAGTVPGTEPTGFSPYAKLFFYETFGGKWPVPTVVEFEKLKGKRILTLREAVADNPRGKLVKVNLPDRLVNPPTQPLGKKAYFSTKGDFLNTKMISPEIDLTKATTAKVTFDTWFEIETGYDYAYLSVVKADGTLERVKSFTGTTAYRWQEQEADLTPYVGQKIKLQFEYVTDIALTMEGMYVDNITVHADGQVVFQDDVEGEAKFTLQGFKLFDGSPIPYPNYYLIEWRSHNGVDQGLAHIRRGFSNFVYDSGMVVWYYDGRWGEDNMTGLHPGEGFLGVVDAHQRGHYWSTGLIGSTRYQINDAAFGLRKTTPIDIQYPDDYMKYDSLPGVPVFYDGNDYSSPFNPSGGKKLPYHGLKVEVKLELPKQKGAIIEISKVKKR